MKILVLSDQEDAYLWDYYRPGRLDAYDLILSAGDLKASYLSFLVTMARVPVLYVHGNHDSNYAVLPPEGCDCIEDTLIEYQGIRILGLGGCCKYKQAPHQYTEKQMQRRIAKLHRKLRRAGGVDIVLTHAAPQGNGDLPDHAHRGFACFLDLIDRWHPKFWVHGHTHLNYGVERLHTYHGTQIVNACQRYVIEIDPPSEAELAARKRHYRFRPDKTN